MTWMIWSFPHDLGNLETGNLVCRKCEKNGVHFCVKILIPEEIKIMNAPNLALGVTDSLWSSGISLSLPIVMHLPWFNRTGIDIHQFVNFVILWVGMP